MPGEGSVFRFTAAFGRGEVEEVVQVSPEDLHGLLEQDAGDGAILHEEFAGCRVLLAEDNSANQKLGVILLRQAGLEVDVAENGLQAVEAVRSGNYDAVFMDVQMPEMDGLEATRVIRGDARLAGLPIIAMTANAMKGDREQCLEAGMNDYLSKPIDPEVLFAILQRWIGPWERAVPAGTASRAGEDSKEGLEKLAGPIGVAEVLKRVGGNEQLLRELLRDFAAHFDGAVTEIREALAQEDGERARRLAHTLKGTAGNLSAKGLQAAALALEMAIRGGEEDMEELFDQVDQELEQVLEAIGSLDEGSDEAPPAEEDGGNGWAPDKKALVLLLAEIDGYTSRAAIRWKRQRGSRGSGGR